MLVIITGVLRQFKGRVFPVNTPPDTAHTQLAAILLHPLGLFRITLAIYNIILIAEAQIFARRLCDTIVSCRYCSAVLLAVDNDAAVLLLQLAAVHQAVVCGAVIYDQHFDILIHRTQNTLNGFLYILFPIIYWEDHTYFSIIIHCIFLSGYSMSIIVTAGFLLHTSSPKKSLPASRLFNLSRFHLKRRLSFRIPVTEI